MKKKKGREGERQRGKEKERERKKERDKKQRKRKEEKTNLELKITSICSTKLEAEMLSKISKHPPLLRPNVHKTL